MVFPLSADGACQVSVTAELPPVAATKLSGAEVGV